jgi:hypothetical protein
MDSEPTPLGLKLKSESFFNPYNPQEFNIPLRPGNFGEVYLGRLNTTGTEGEVDMKLLRTLVEGVNNIAVRIFYPQRGGGQRTKEARLIVSADVGTIKASPGKSLKDVMRDDDILTQIGLNTPYWVEIPGADGEPDKRKRYLVFRRKLGKDDSDLLIAIDGKGSGIIKDVDDVEELIEENKMGEERIPIRGKDGLISRFAYDILVPTPKSSLNVTLYCIPSDKT